MASKTKRSLLVIRQAALEEVSILFPVRCRLGLQLRTSSPPRPFQADLYLPSLDYRPIQLLHTLRPSEAYRTTLETVSRGSTSRGKPWNLSAWRISQTQTASIDLCHIIRQTSPPQKCCYTRTSSFIPNQAHLFQAIRSKARLQFMGNL